MKILQARLAQYNAPQKVMAAGIYPYFRPFIVHITELNDILQELQLTRRSLQTV